MNRFLSCTSVMALCAGLAFSATAYGADAAQPSAATAAMPTTLDGQIQRARTLRQQGNLKDASDALRQMMLVAGSDARVVSEYGKVLAQQGYAKDAVTQLQHAVQLTGADWSVYSALGVAYDQLDDRENARKAYDRALAMKPGEPSVLNNYAVSRMLAGDYDGAIQTLTQLKSISTDPKIIANLEKAEELKAAHPQGKASVTAASAPAKPSATVAVASSPTPAAANAATVAPKPPAATPANTTREASAAPRTLGEPSSTPSNAASIAKNDSNAKNVVMQKVPMDPMAGPVKIAAAKPAPAKAADRKPAGVAKAQTKPAPAKASAPPPTLRTASD